MDFPIPKLARLPIQISPCPILNAVLEIRFVTGEDWALLPGLLYTQIKERYPKFENLPIAEMPEEIFRIDPNLIYAPRMRFLGQGFIVQFGPRVVSLLTRDEYPGWQRIKKSFPGCSNGSSWRISSMRANAWECVTSTFSRMRIFFPDWCWMSAPGDNPYPAWK